MLLSWGAREAFPPARVLSPPPRTYACAFFLLFVDASLSRARLCRRGVRVAFTLQRAQIEETRESLFLSHAILDKMQQLRFQLRFLNAPCVSAPRLYARLFECDARRRRGGGCDLFLTEQEELIYVLRADFSTCVKFMGSYAIRLLRDIVCTRRS